MTDRWPAEKLGFPALDPARTAEVIRQGLALWRAERDDPPDLKDVVWRLVADAVETQRALNTGAPAGYRIAWPDIVMSEGEITGAYNDRNTEVREALRDGRTPEGFWTSAPHRPAAPSAQALARYLDVMSWLRYVRARSGANRRTRLRMLLALAGGLSPTKAARAFPELGYGNRHAVLAAKTRALVNIEARLRATCPQILSIAA